MNSTNFLSQVNYLVDLINFSIRNRNQPNIKGNRGKIDSGVKEKARFKPLACFRGAIVLIRITIKPSFEFSHFISNSTLEALFTEQLKTRPCYAFETSSIEWYCSILAQFVSPSKILKRALGHCWPYYAHNQNHLREKAQRVSPLAGFPE